MKILLVGYGKMGRMVEAAALERGHTIIAVVDPYAGITSKKDLARESEIFPTLRDVTSLVPKIDVALEFTKPDTALENIKDLMDLKLPVVVGTTGWHDRLNEVHALVDAAGSSLLWASNFSLGVNLFYRIASYAASLVDPFSEYDVGGFEAHHNQKADSPSGTAKTLVERILASMTRKKEPCWESLNRPPKPEELHFPSLRLGAIPGTHSVYLDSSADTIEITHRARNREGLALGAVRAAEWLAQTGKTRRGVFTMDDVLADILA